MGFHISGTFNDPYMHQRVRRRAARANTCLDLQFTLILMMDLNSPRLETSAFPNPFDWSELFEWLEKNHITRYYTYSPFSEEHRRYIGFEHEEDAMLFYMRFK